MHSLLHRPLRSVIIGLGYTSLGSTCRSGICRHASLESLQTQSHFDLLGVHRDATREQVKRSFYQKAKELHPDVNRDMNQDEAKQAFNLISTAYETLIDDAKRRSYCYELDRRRDAAAAHREGGAAAAGAAADPDDWGDIFSEFKAHATGKKWSHMKQRKQHGSGGISGMAAMKHMMMERKDTFFEQVRREFEEAMAKAYMGPRFEGAAHEFPWEFESEERRRRRRRRRRRLAPGAGGAGAPGWGRGEGEEDGPALMELVSGRQLLGRVALGRRRPAADGLLPLCKEEAFSQVHQKQQHPKNNHHQRNKNGMRDRVELELEWQGLPLAYAVRHFHSNGNYAKNSIEVFLDDQTTDKPAKHLATIEGLKAADSPRSPCHATVTNARGEPTHRLAVFWTPGVQHMLWFGDKGILECKCSRAWLPSSKYWYFEPRKDSHDIGGWYYEIQRNSDRKDGLRRLQPRLHPAVYIFASAFKALEQEDQGEDISTWHNNNNNDDEEASGLFSTFFSSYRR